LNAEGHNTAIGNSAPYCRVWRDSSGAPVWWRAPYCSSIVIEALKDSARSLLVFSAESPGRQKVFYSWMTLPDQRQVGQNK